VISTAPSATSSARPYAVAIARTIVGIACARPRQNCRLIGDAAAKTGRAIRLSWGFFPFSDLPAALRMSGGATFRTMPLRRFGRPRPSARNSSVPGPNPRVLACRYVRSSLRFFAWRFAIVMEAMARLESLRNRVHHLSLEASPAEPLRHSPEVFCISLAFQSCSVGSSPPGRRGGLCIMARRPAPLMGFRPSQLYSGRTVPTAFSAAEAHMSLKSNVISPD